MPGRSRPVSVPQGDDPLYAFKGPGGGPDPRPSPGRRHIAAQQRGTVPLPVSAEPHISIQASFSASLLPVNGAAQSKRPAVSAKIIRMSNGSERRTFEKIPGRQQSPGLLPSLQHQPDTYRPGNITARVSRSGFSVITAAASTIIGATASPGRAVRPQALGRFVPHRPANRFPWSANVKGASRL